MKEARTGFLSRHGESQTVEEVRLQVLVLDVSLSTLQDPKTRAADLGTHFDDGSSDFVRHGEGGVCATRR